MNLVQLLQSVAKTNNLMEKVFENNKNLTCIGDQNRDSTIRLFNFGVKLIRQGIAKTHVKRQLKSSDKSCQIEKATSYQQ